VEDAPEILPEVPTPPVSPLFAMASAGPRLGRGWLIGIGALGTLVLGLIVFTLLCSGTFFSPTKHPRFCDGRTKNPECSAYARAITDAPQRMARNAAHEQPLACDLWTCR
jgi:hypothetical protein